MTCAINAVMPDICDSTADTSLEAITIGNSLALLHTIQVTHLAQWRNEHISIEKHNSVKRLGLR